MFGGLDFLLAPWAEPWFWSMPVGVAQEVGGSQFHLKEARGCVARKGKDGGELCGGGEWEVISRFMPDLPLLEESATNLGA